MLVQKSSYRQILRSTSFFGAASGFDIVLRILRAKVLAVLLGPAGIGMMGMLTSLLGTASSLAGLGIGVSGVREIGDARGRNDAVAIAQSLRALQIATITLALLGSLMVFLFRAEISTVTFGDTGTAATVGWLSVGVFATVAGGSLRGVLQGFRKVGDQVRVQISSSIMGTVAAVACVGVWGKNGIILFVLAVPTTALVVGWYYARRITIARCVIEGRVIRRGIVRMATLGFPVMLGVTIHGWAVLAMQSKITQEAGIGSTGIFQAAWSISFVYLGFVLEAMARDYYPRLTEIAGDNDAVRQVVNEQMHIALVLAAPVLIGMMTLSPLAVSVLYAESFAPAASIIQWMTLGNVLKILTWSMGFVMLAKGKNMHFLFTQLNFNLLFLGMSWGGLSRYGLAVVGPAFLLTWIAHLFVVYFIVRRLSCLVVTKRNVRIALAIMLSCVAVFVLGQLLPSLAYVCGGIVTVAAGIFAHREMTLLIGQSPLVPLLSKLGVR